MLSRSRQTEEFRERPATNPAVAIIAAVAVMLGGAGVVGLLAQGAPKIDAPTLVAGTATRTLPSQPAPKIAAVQSQPPDKTPVAPTRAPAEPTSSPAPRRTPEPVAPQAAPAVVAELKGPSPRLNPRRASTSDLVEASGEPRLKPAAGSAALVADSTLSSDLIVLGQKMLAPDEPRASFYFDDEIAGAVAPPAPPAVRLAGDIDEAPETVSVNLTRGENFVDALRRAGVRAEDRNAAALAFGKLYDLRRLRPGQELKLTTAAPARTLFQMVAEGHERESYLLGLDFKADATSRIALTRGPDGAFSGKAADVKLSTRLASVSGRINGSLYNSAKRIGAPDKVVADLAAIFAYDVDFQREVFGGDEFEAVFEARYDENGRLVEAGDVLYGRMKWKGRQKEEGYYRFASADGGAKADYFDWSGESAKRLLMKTPIDGARLSSGFGARRHPISGYTKQHKGVDFAASRGTPIKAAGDGVVERADRYGGYGNYIRIRHGQGYKTAYGHMSGFAKGIRAGKRVEQGDIIGYVGSTGASTGPHLHYEVLQEGKHVNPQKLKVATGVSLGGADLKKFKAARDELDAKRKASVLAEDTSAKQL